MKTQNDRTLFIRLHLSSIPRAADGALVKRTRPASRSDGITNSVNSPRWIGVSDSQHAWSGVSKMTEEYDPLTRTWTGIDSCA